MIPELPSRRPAVSPGWGEPAFAAALTAWCAEAVGLLLAAEEVKRRPWSTVWRVHTTDGVWWAKQNCPLEAFEPALLVELGRLVPELVVPVAAADASRGLLLTADAGPTVRDSGGGLDAWSAVLSAAAQLQRAVLPGLDRLVDAGLTPLTDLPAYAADRTAALADLPPGHPQRLDPADAQRLIAALPAVRRWADQLADLDLPATLNHNDLHDANVFADVSGGDRLRFFDLGDALLTHPLLSLAVPLGILAEQHETAVVRRAADAFLEVWSDLAPMRSLRAALPAALRLGWLGRVETWLRVEASFTDAELAEHGAAPGASLMRVLDDPPL